MIKSIWILLAIAAYHDYEIWQMDVKKAFLNSYLEEELFMTQPEGFMSKSKKTKSMGPKTPEEIQQMSVVPYASAIGSLMYAMICTRPDIAYAVSITSRYQSNPRSEYWAAVKIVLKYLRRTKDMFLVYGEVTELRVEAYTDTDFQSELNDRSSNSDMCSL
ncbi:secreted RxLR effector protein 161-like [Pyrus communis]|uniref:secreted RxLR effector protein 161-like n=1 Tax=Pyrus communis TaxID=23211 RepID=UPI0035C0AE4F